MGSSTSVWAVFLIFLKLGCVSFGGPIAHLGYFRHEFVTRRAWLDDARYTDLVALCQFLPGPASSQVGIALGLQRAGGWGALAAWIGFTLPSAVAMVLFAIGVFHGGDVVNAGVLHGLKLVAVAVVAQAVYGMARSSCPDPSRMALAALCAGLALAMPSALGQWAVLGVGGLFGWRCMPVLPPALAVAELCPVSKRGGAALLFVGACLLVALPLVAARTDVALMSAIATAYRSGALVFGGGHVVLPMLQAGFVPSGWVSADAFLAGYGAAQALPGPLFAFAAYLGALMTLPAHAWLGGAALVVAIFLPAFVWVVGALPYWMVIKQQPTARRVVAGINAAVVGLLAAALYDPVWTSAVHGWRDAGLAVLAWWALMRRTPVWLVVVASAGVQALLQSAGV